MSLVVSRNSQLERGQIEHYLHHVAMPMKLAVNGVDGTPLVASHWFLYRDGAFYCVLHKSSRIAVLLEKDPRCGFEVGSDQPPYKGVRGQGQASLDASETQETLQALLARYQIKPNSRLATWLLGRVADERVLCIRPQWVSGWDFSERMADAVG